MNFDKIYIDIRDEHELLENYLVSTNEKVFIASIPMRVIFANTEWIQRQKCDVVIVCRSGHRALKIKNEYFSNNTNVTVLDGGINGIDTKTHDNLKIVHGLGGFGQQQYLQLMFAVILTLVLLLTIFPGMYTKYIIIGFIAMILYQVFGKKCYLASIIPLPRFISQEI
jgi:rhodanese-related sulfurtransferase